MQIGPKITLFFEFNVIVGLFKTIVFHSLASGCICVFPFVRSITLCHMFVYKKKKRSRTYNHIQTSPVLVIVWASKKYKIQRLLNAFIGSENWQTDFHIICHKNISNCRLYSSLHALILQEWNSDVFILHPLNLSKPEQSVVDFLLKLFDLYK